MRAYTAGNTDVPSPEETIGRNLERVAARYPFHDALVEAAAVPGGDARRWSYTKMNDDVDRLARALLAWGIRKGDSVGLWSPNCAEWTLLQYAAAKAGAVLVSIDSSCGSNALEYVAKHSGLRLLLVAPADSDRDYVTMARSALDKCPALRLLVFLPDHEQEGLDAGIPLADGELMYSELLKRADAVGHSALQDRMAKLDPQDPISLQYSSETTVSPAVATRTHHDLLTSGYFVGKLLGYTEHDRAVLPVPLYESFGQVAGNLAALSHGAATIIPGRGFSPAAVLEAVQDFGGTVLYGAPGMFSAELSMPDFDSYDLSTLRTAIISGPLPSAELRNQVIAWMDLKDGAVCQDGWMRTGDPARLNEDGYVALESGSIRGDL